MGQEQSGRSLATLRIKASLGIKVILLGSQTAGIRAAPTSLSGSAAKTVTHLGLQAFARQAVCAQRRTAAFPKSPDHFKKG